MAGVAATPKKVGSGGRTLKGLLEREITVKDLHEAH
jgi:hypothetical protein